jgi:hypothetical protein
MNTRLLKILTGIAIGLVVIIMVEYTYARHAEKTLSKELETISAGIIETEILPKINLKITPIKSYIDLVNRPLFSQTRRPMAKVAEGIIKPAVTVGKFTHELIGIFGKATQMRALFRKKKLRIGKINKNNNNKFTTVKIGETIDGWQIQKINSNTVIVDNNGNIETIKWSKSKPKTFKTLRELAKKKTPPKSKQETKAKIAKKNNVFSQSATPPQPRR